MNTLHPKIKVTFKISPESSNFLDLTIFKGIRFFKSQPGILDFKVYQKPHNSYHYIALTSDHPEHTPGGLINTELVRYVRNSSDEELYKEIKNNFFFRLRERGFDTDFLNTHMEKVKYSNRKEYLKNATIKANKNQIFFKVTHNSRLKDINLSQIFKENDDISHNFVEYILGRHKTYTKITQD